MKAYVINLDSRTDRWNEVLKNQATYDFEIVRVSAIPSDELLPEALNYAAPGVAATWLSHRKAAKEFLDSGEDYGLILEDDFVLGKNFRIGNFEKIKLNNIDFLQFGFLTVSRWEALDIFVANLKSFIVWVIARLVDLSVPGFSGFGSRTLVKEIRNLPSFYVPADIRPGGHCYLISKKMAQGIQILNNPIIFSADELYISISKMRAFKMVRLRRSSAWQSNSKSSVTQRFKQL